eukprot:12323819-Alexandrium_andersonii.AAC.1
MTLSSKWARLHEDPLANKQRWYCNVCGQSFKVAYGVICEFAQGPDEPVLWCRATVPDDPFKDI